MTRYHVPFAAILTLVAVGLVLVARVVGPIAAALHGAASALP